MRPLRGWWLCMSLLASACAGCPPGGQDGEDGGAAADGAKPAPDAAAWDAAAWDAAEPVDASMPDAHVPDAAAPADAAAADAAPAPDAALPDAARPPDAGTPPDAAVVVADAGAPDAAALPPDAGVPVREACPQHAQLPAWVTADADGGSFTARAGQLSVRVHALEEGILRLRYQGTLDTGPERSWAVVNPVGNPSGVQAGSRDGAFTLCTPVMGLRVNAQLRVTAWDADGHVILDDGLTGGYFEDPLGGTRKLIRTAVPEERFYGLGERTGPALDKRNGVYTFWNTDAYVGAYGGFPPNADPLYQSIPLLLGLRGGRAYGVFTDNPYRMQLDLCSHDPAIVEWSALAGPMDQYLMAGPELSTVLQRYTALTGRMPLPPRWALGYHQSRWGYPTQARVQDVMQTFRDKQLPADSLWLDIQHMDGFRSFTFDPVNYADPAALVAYGAARGFKVLTIVDPGIKQDVNWDVYQQGVAGSHFLTTPDGSLYVGQVWPGDSVFPDFTRAATRAWWGQLITRATGVGIAGLWIDMNEPSDSAPGMGGTVPNTLLADGDGTPTTLAEVHNVYALNMQRATYEGLRAARPDARPFVLTRAGYASGQRYAAVWTGDAPSTWATLNMTLPMVLNMGMSGMAFVGSDVGGYSGNPGGEMFARWLQLGSISPFFRGHVTRDVPDQEPWAFGVEVEYISKVSLGERYRLLPYLYTLFEESSRTGAPVLRPLVWEFQADAAVAGLGDEAMLGPWLLYAPVTAPGQTVRRVYLPAGRWFDYRSGALVEGPTSVDLDVRLEALPAYVREGAILPHGPLLQSTGERALDPLQLDVYPAQTRTTQALYEDAGDAFAYQQGAFRRVTYTLQATESGATLQAGAPEGSWTPPSRKAVVRVRRADRQPGGVALDGVDLPVQPSLEALYSAERGWWWDRADLSIWVTFQDRAPFTLDLQYDRTILVNAPTVRVPLEVEVPPGTPAGSPISVATSANGWQQQPLAWAPGNTRAAGEVVVPRGHWFEYKYTRGGWDTVEKWGGCLEATNRYAFGAAHPGKQDRVDTWADWCP